MDTWDALVAAAPGLITIVLVSALAIWLIQRIVPWLAGKLPSRMRFRVLPWAPILRLVVLALALWASLRVLAVEDVVLILSAFGVAVGFAFKDYVSSIIAGIVVIYERPYRVGDWVEMDGHYGEIKAVDMRVLRLVTPDDNLVTIPHHKLWTESIANANDGQRDLMCVAEFFVESQHDGRTVRQALWDVGMTSPYTNLARPVVVHLTEKPWATRYRLKAYPLDGRDQFEYVSDLTVCGKEALAGLHVRPAAVAAAPDCE